jgi:hypothetical protein
MSSLVDIPEPWRSFLRRNRRDSKRRDLPEIYGRICRDSALRIFHIQRDRDEVRHLVRLNPFDLGTLRQRYEKESRRQVRNPTRENLTLQLWIEAIHEERTSLNSLQQSPS